MPNLEGRSGPLYRRLAEDITEQIQTGALRAGDKLPSERVLCDTYGVSQITVRRALRELRHAGALVSRHGLGWFVDDGAASGSAAAPGAVLAPAHDAVLLLPTLSGHMGTLAEGLSAALARRGLGLHLEILYPAAPSGLAAGGTVAGARALLVVPPDPAPPVDALPSGANTLLLYREVEGSELPAAAIDEQECTALVTRYLLDLGHRQIAYLGADPSTREGERRYWGFATALWDGGYDLPMDWVFTGALGDGPAASRFAGVFRGDARPTALVCADDLLALSALSALQALGLRCPQDVAIASVGDRDFAALLPTPLTSLRFDLPALAEAAAEMVVALLEGRPVETRRVTGAVIPRVSCGSSLPAPRRDL